MPTAAATSVATVQEAQRKARFGHRDWLGWTSRDGVRRYAPRSPETLKAALLAIGTAGRFTLISADTGTLMNMNWRMGVRTLWAARRFGW